MKCRSGFTLIELLVVIAIISVLATILIPALDQAKSLAKQAVCLSNLRGIGTGLSMYSSECEGVLPPIIAYQSVTRIVTWDIDLAPYVSAELGDDYEWGGSGKIPEDGKTDIFACPSDDWSRSEVYGGRPRSYAFVTHFPSILFNESTPINWYHRPAEQFVVTEWHATWNSRGMNQPGVCVDYLWWNYGYNWGSLPAKWANAGGPSTSPADSDYHGTGNHYLYVDGHVSLLDYDQAEETSHWSNLQ